MSSILGPIQKLGTVLNGLSSDKGDVVIWQLTAPPQQPQAADFPMLLIEFDWEQEGKFQVHSWGAGHNVYPLNILIFVGVPSAGTNIADLHDAALAWVKPLGTALFSNIELSGVDNVLMLGYGGVDNGSEDVFRYKIGKLQWNQQTFYGLRATTWIKEDFNLAMA